MVMNLKFRYSILYVRICISRLGTSRASITYSQFLQFSHAVHVHLVIFVAMFVIHCGGICNLDLGSLLSRLDIAASINF